jgi:hypothetical protein
LADATVRRRCTIGAAMARTSASFESGSEASRRRSRGVQAREAADAVARGEDSADAAMRVLKAACRSSGVDHELLLADARRRAGRQAR